MAGKLYLVPVPLGEVPPADTLPASTLAVARALPCWVAEDARSARRFLVKLPLVQPVQALRIEEIRGDTPPARLAELLQPLREGLDVGVVSEAGCPGVADPGARLVAAAHAEGIEVVPLVGPSSLLLTLMGSGLEGQRFAFRGYLPAKAAERVQALRDLETRSARDDETQLWIETPYRAQAMLESVLEACRPDTRLALGSELTLPGQGMRMKPVAGWRKTPPELDGRLVVFALLAKAAVLPAPAAPRKPVSAGRAGPRRH